MVKTLRRKFIVITMLVIFFVLGGIVGVINVVNYTRLNENAAATMRTLVQNDGVMPVPEQTENNSGTGTAETLPPLPPEREDEFPEEPFKARYFTVRVSDGETEINTENVFSVDDNTALSYVGAVQKGKNTGYYKDFYYSVTEKSDGTLYIFLDCARELSGARELLTTSLIVFAVAVALMFALILIFSKAVFRSVEESYEKQKRFITDANHELKTPLTIISASNEILELNYGESEWTKTIDGQVKRLKDLTDKLVFLSRMDENGNKINRAEFNLSNAVEEVASDFLPLAKASGKTLELNISPDVKYNGDEALLGRLTSLLLDNAFKYSNDSGTISVSLTSRGNEKKLVFFNTVDEIEKGNLSVLFERFYRPDKSRNSSTGGHGIGLSVAQAIVTAHMGRITAKSKDGKSVEFTVTL